MPARRYKAGQCRLQESLLPPRLEDYVDQGNHVRAIDAYVNSLDLAQLGFLHAAGRAAQAGQPAYDPADLLKLYMYGYTNKVRSSRCLERETQRNLEVIWLLGGLTPSYKTIADFRKHNARALMRVNREFTLLCRELALFGGHTVGIDGSFFRANASKGSIHTQDKLKKQIASLEQDIEAWHAELDQNDRQDGRPDTPTTTEDPSLTTKLEAMQEKLAAKQEQLQTLEASGDKQVSTTDPDARRLTKRGQSVSGYNVQIAVDDKHKLIAASGVTNEGNDSHQLAPMAEKTKAALGVETLTALSDAGYYESDQLKQCEDNGVTAYVAIRTPRNASTRTVASPAKPSPTIPNAMCICVLRGRCCRARMARPGTTRSGTTVTAARGVIAPTARCEHSACLPREPSGNSTAGSMQRCWNVTANAWRRTKVKGCASAVRWPNTPLVP